MKMYTIKQANQELKKAVDYIIANKSSWNDIRDLKLHDVRGYCWFGMKESFPLCYEEDEKNDYFGWFCDNESLFFKEYLEEEKLENILNYIRRSSSFYIGNYGERTTIDGIENILFDCCFLNYIEFVSNNDKLQIQTYRDYEENDEEVQKELEYIVEYIYNDVKDRLKDIIKVAKYIDTYKKYQVESFKIFLEDKERELQEEKNKEQEEKNKYNNSINNILDKTINILNEDERNFINNLLIK